MYVLGSGLYSWSNKYSQPCVLTNDCQTRGFEVQESHDLWIYNLCTKAIVEMIGPVGAIPTYARDNVDGYLSSILAWLGGATSTTGRRKFKGYQFWTRNDLEDYRITETRLTALTEKAACEDEMRSWVEPSYRGVTGNVTLTNFVCDAGCGESLQSCSRRLMAAAKATISALRYLRCLAVVSGRVTMRLASSRSMEQIDTAMESEDACRTIEAYMLT